MSLGVAVVNAKSNWISSTNFTMERESQNLDKGDRMLDKEKRS